MFKLYLQGVFQCVIKLHDCCLVSTPITIVWGAEDRHYISVVAPIVTLDEDVTLLSNSHHVMKNLHLAVSPRKQQNGWQWINKVYVPPSPAGGLLKPKWGRLRGWTSQRCPARRCNQHHGVRFPSRRDHLGLTITSHTLDPKTWRKHQCCFICWTCKHKIYTTCRATAPGYGKVTVRLW